MSACECAYVRACVCDMAPGYKEPDHTLEERKSSLNSLNRAAVKACGKPGEVTLGLRFWQKEP